MSKLSFRARALDPSKPMPIYLAEELPDLQEYSAINRAVPQMPSGMEKEEESEHHLQRAICTGLIIPTPEVFVIEQEDFFDKYYPANYKMPRQMIHMQPLGLEQDIPDYDMDSADEMWVNQQMKRLDLTPLKFEHMMDRLEKSSEQTVVLLNEAKALLKQDDEVSIAVYDYWLNKRLKTQHPLILSVKTENRPGTSTNNPYLAFRRRTEKMQTRKNRKNDETSYEKMLKLKRDLQRAVTLLEMVKKREKTKREHLHLSIEIFEKRFQARDFSGSIVNELSLTYKTSRPAFAPLYTNQYSHHSSMQHPSGGILSSSLSSSHQYTTPQYLNSSSIGDANSRDTILSTGGHSTSSRKEKRQYRKRKHKLHREKQSQQQYSSLHSSSPAPIESNIEDTEDEDIFSGVHHITGTSGINGGGGSSEGEDDGLFAFKRKKNCEYLKPKTTKYGNWPWESKEDCGAGDPKYRYTLTSLRTPRQQCIGFARRRVGRGGRIILDRVRTNMDDFWSLFDHTIRDSQIKSQSNNDSNENENVDRDQLYLSSSSDRIQNFEHLHSQAQSQSQYNQQRYPQQHKLFRNRNNSEQSTSYISGGVDDQSPAPTIEMQSDIEESSSLATQSAAAAFATTTDPINVKRKMDDILTSNSLSGVEKEGSSSFNNLNSNLLLMNNNRTHLNNDLNSSNSVSSSNLNENISYNVIKTEVVLDDNVSINQEQQEDAMVTDSLSSNNNHNADILDDEDVNLARLSSYIKTSSNFRKNNHVENSNIRRNSTPFDEFLQEVRNDWLHFRPKTPPPLPSLSPTDCLVEFSEDTKIQIEMQRLRRDTLTPPSSVSAAATSNIVLFNDCDPLFLTEPFSYADIRSSNNTENNLFSVTSTPAESPKDDLNNSQSLLNEHQSKQNSGIDFNLSGESLNELNLSLGDAEDNQKVLESFLQECQIDDINQQPNFWNGILEDGNVLLDVIGGGVGGDESKKNKTPKQRAHKVRHWKRYQLGNCSKFTIKNSIDRGKDDSYSFFKKDDLKSLSVKNEQQTSDIIASPVTQGSISSTSCILASNTTKGTSAITDSSNQSLPKIPLSNQIQSQQLISVPLVQPQIIQNQPIAVVYSTNSSSNYNFTQQSPQQQILRQYPATNVTTQQQQQQQRLNIKLHKQQQQRIVTQGVTQILTSNQQQNFLQNKIYFKQDSGSSNQNTTVFTLSSLKIENNDQQPQGSNSIDPQNTPLIVATTPKQSTGQSGGQTGQTQIINVSNSALAAAAARGGSIIIDGTIDGNGTYVLTSGLGTNQQQKRTLNGPNTIDRNALQSANRKLGRQFQIQRQPQKQVQAVQQFQIIKQDDENTEVSQSSKSINTSASGCANTSNNGNFVKLSSYPIVVSDLNSQQQNTLSAVASNHNYSLQPTSQPIVIGSSQSTPGGGKIIFSSAGGNTTGHVIPHLKEIPTTNLKLKLLSGNSNQQTQQSSQMIQQQQQTISNNQQQTQNPQQQTRVKLDRNSSGMLIEQQSDGSSPNQQKRVVYSKLRFDGSQIAQFSTTGQILTKNKFPITNMRPLQQHQIINAGSKSNPAGAGVATTTVVTTSQTTADKLNNSLSATASIDAAATAVNNPANTTMNSTTASNSINR